MPRIMLVDDERNVLNSLRRTIYAMPSNTFESETIVETFDIPELALARAADRPFDLVISDWRMPSMNGIIFLTELIQIQPNIARIVLSGYGDFLSELRAIKSINIFRFINKPWDNEELRVLIGQALEQRRLLMESQQASGEESKRESRLSEVELPNIDPQQPSVSPTKREFSFQNRIELRS